MTNPYHLRSPEEFPLVLGGSLPEMEIVWEQWGDPALPGDRTILIMPDLAGSSHVRSHEEGPTPGWWEQVVGPGLGIDTERFRVICAASLGAPFGTTSPISTHPLTGRTYGRNFPQITPADQARCHARLLDHVGLERVRSVVGAGLGAMQALQFAAHYPDRQTRAVCISGTGKTTPATVALRRVGRRAIMNDPDYHEGRYEGGRGPSRGLALARELDTICAGSRDDFNVRFSWDPVGPYTAQSATFEVEADLAHQGERFATVFDANCYLLLSRCMDLMDLGAGHRTYADGVLRITCPLFIVGVDRDILIPPSEQQHLAHLLESHGRDVRLEILPSLHGHAAYLSEPEWFNKRLREFL